MSVGDDVTELVGLKKADRRSTPTSKPAWPKPRPSKRRWLTPGFPGMSGGRRSSGDSTGSSRPTTPSTTRGASSLAGGARRASRTTAATVPHDPWRSPHPHSAVHHRRHGPQGMSAHRNDVQRLRVAGQDGAAAAWKTPRRRPSIRHPVGAVAPSHGQASRVRMGRTAEGGMHQVIRIVAGSPWGLWPEAAAIALALLVAPVLAAVWPEE